MLKMLTPTRGLALAVLAALFLLLLAVALTWNTDMAPRQATEKVTEIDNPTLTGFHAGKKVWELKARSAWTGADPNKINFEQLTGGRVYSDKGKVLVDKLRAATAFADKNNNIIEIGKAGSSLKALVAIQLDDKARSLSRLEALLLRYEPAEEKALLPQGFTLRQGATVLSGKNLRLEFKKDTISMDKDIVLKRGKIMLITQAVRGSIKDKHYRADSSVKFFLRVAKPVAGEAPVMDMYPAEGIWEMPSGIRFTRGGNPTSADAAGYFEQEDILTLNGNARTEDDGSSIRADQITFLNKPDRLTADGNVELSRRGKTATCNALSVAPGKKGRKLLLSGNVNAILEKGSDLLKKPTAKKIKSREAQKTLAGKVNIKADQLTLTSANDNAYASGNVEVTQNNKLAKADTAFYDDGKEKIFLKKNVYLRKENGDFMHTDMVVVDIRKESFEAEKVKEAKFKIKK